MNSEREIAEQPVTHYAAFDRHRLRVYRILGAATRLVLQQLFDNFFARVKSVAREIAAQPMQFQERNKKQRRLGKARNAGIAGQCRHEALGAPFGVRYDLGFAGRGTEFAPFQNVIPKAGQCMALRLRERSEPRLRPVSAETR
jgi:hypothetical protein